MKKLLFIISLFGFYGLHAQKVSGYWFGQANVAMQGINNNYLTELIIAQKGTKVRGFFGYYFKDVYESFLVKGSYDPKTRKIIIRDIPIIYFNTNSTVNSVDCITSFYGTLLVSKLQSTLTGYFYRDKKYEYTCPDLRVSYTLFTEAHVEDSVFKDLGVTKMYWKEPPETSVASRSKAEASAKKPTDSLSHQTQGTATAVVTSTAIGSTSSLKPGDAPKKQPQATPAAVGQATTSGAATTQKRTDSLKNPAPTADEVAGINTNAANAAPAKVTSPGITDPPVAAPVLGADIVKIQQEFKKRKELPGKELIVASDSIRLSFYDDAEVDGDSISVFFNNKLLISHQELTERAFNLYITLDSQREINEVSMFAENLGKYPPNTALMVLNDGEQRYEIYMSSDLKGNATVRLKRKKPR
jgi:hypothetical protein